MAKQNKKDAPSGNKLTSALLSDCTVAETLGYPIIVLSGKSEVHIENHKGIAEYESDAITVLGSKYDIRITGSELIIKSMNADALVITGDINAVTF